MEVMEAIIQKEMMVDIQVEEVAIQIIKEEATTVIPKAIYPLIAVIAFNNQKLKVEKVTKILMIKNMNKVSQPINNKFKKL